ncbi:MAG: pyridoxal phosphate-dependent aminotransferase [Desulfurococcales archaeon]|nr:pyridoxal phosphate-dependent aminotransferase [Desulfurococcales archaeon]
MESKPPTLNLTPEVHSIEGETSFAYLSKAREVHEKKGIPIYSFGIGQPDFPTPKHIVEAAKKALDEGFTGYTETAGIPELRQAISDYLNGRYHGEVSPDEIVVTPGAKNAIYLTLASYITEGDEVIIVEPSYYAYAMVVKMRRGKPVFAAADFVPGKGFVVNTDKILDKITSKTKAIVINNPHNPTGSIFSPSQINGLVEIAKEKGILLVSDEIYDNFVFHGQFKSLLEYEDWRDNSIVINGFSKTFSMTGWRLGYLVARKEAIPRLTSLAVTMYSCATSFAQKAGAVALRGDWTPVREMIQEFKERAKLLHSELSKIPGFENYLPEGAFYLYPRVENLLKMVNMNTEQFVNYLLEEKGVVVLPGASFPDKAGINHIRFSFATSRDVIKKGTELIKEAVEELLNK